MNRLKKWTFWVLSRVGGAVYSRLPVFGRLPGAVGVIANKNAFLVIERNDGRGVSFPGGLGFPRESAEQTLVREIHEETGLKVTKSLLLFHYPTSTGIPVNLTVFAVEAEGKLRNSWEGTPVWLELPELRIRIIRSQQRIVETLCESEFERSVGSGLT